MNHRYSDFITSASFIYSLWFHLFSFSSNSRREEQKASPRSDRKWHHSDIRTCCLINFNFAHIQEDEVMFRLSTLIKGIMTSPLSHVHTDDITSSERFSEHLPRYSLNMKHKHANCRLCVYDIVCTRGSSLINFLCEWECRKRQKTWWWNFVLFN